MKSHALNNAYLTLRHFGEIEFRGARPAEPGPAVHRAERLIRDTLQSGGVAALARAGIPPAWAEAEEIRWENDLLDQINAQLDQPTGPVEEIPDTPERLADFARAAAWARFHRGEGPKPE